MNPILSISYQATLTDARQEAVQRKSSFVGTEHVILAILNLPASIAGIALTLLDISFEDTRVEINTYLIEKVTEEPQSHNGIAHSPRLKTVIDLSKHLAAEWGSKETGSGHLLLAVIKEGQGDVAKILNRLIKFQELSSIVHAIMEDPENLKIKQKIESERAIPKLEKAFILMHARALRAEEKLGHVKNDLEELAETI